MFGSIHKDDSNVTFSVKFHYNTVDTVDTVDTVSTVESRDEAEEAHESTKPEHSKTARVETPASFNLSKAQQSIEISNNKK